MRTCICLALLEPSAQNVCLSRLFVSCSYFIYVDAVLETALQKSQAKIGEAKRKFQQSTEAKVARRAKKQAVAAASTQVATEMQER